MISRRLASKLLWILFLCLCSGFLFWQYSSRIERVRFANRIGTETTTASATASRKSFEGHPGNLIMPEHLSRSFTRLRETKQMLGSQDWLMDRIDFENAPKGRSLSESPAYRWWLGLLAVSHHTITGTPVGESVETVAIYSDPLIHALLFLALVIYVVRTFGTLPGAVCGLMLVGLFPLTEAYLPAVPDDFALFLLLVPWSILPLFAVQTSDNPRGKGAEPANLSAHYMVSGVAGSLALWLNTGTQSSLLIGILLLKAFIPAASFAPSKDENGVQPSTPWRLWALSGGATIAIICLFISPLSGTEQWNLQNIHPLHGLAWIFLGELLAYTETIPWKQRLNPQVLVRAVLALAALAAIPTLLLKQPAANFFEADTLSFRLSKQIDGVTSPNTASWLSTEGLSIQSAATLLSLAPLVFGVLCLFSSALSRAQKRTLAIAFAPALFSAIMAFRLLQWWQVYGLVTLCLSIVLTRTYCSGAKKIMFSIWAISGSIVLVLGICATLQPILRNTEPTISGPEMQALIERDLAHWIRKQKTPDQDLIVLAAPRTTAALGFYGDFKGIASLSKQNVEGLSAALRVVVATSWDEARLLMEQRKISYLVVNSWDEFYEGYVAANAGGTTSLLLDGLKRFQLPSWLKPVAFQLPTAQGFENASLRLYKVVEDQDAPSAACRLVEYFIEMNEIQNAKVAALDLKRFPSHFGKLVAEAEVAYAAGDADSLKASLREIKARLTSSPEIRLPFDLRVSLALVLARANELDLAKKQTQLCVSAANAERIRTLSSYSLFHFLTLQDILGVKFSNPEFDGLALGLLPEELAQRQIARRAKKA